MKQTEIEAALDEFNARSAKRQYKEFAKTSLVIIAVICLSWTVFAMTIRALADVSATYQARLMEMKRV